jgi:phenylalanyl-tRNA synthetase beta chain
LQPGGKSFTDAELQTLSDQVVKAADKVGARLRG